MSTEGVAVEEGVGALLVRLEEPVAGDHRADGGVAGGHPLRAGDDVGGVAEVRAGEHRPDAAEGADDLVGDEQDVVLVADLADPLEVAGGRREAAAGILHRLEEDRGDGLGSLELDRLGDAVGGPAPEGLGVLPQVLGGAVEVGVGHLVGTGDQRLEVGLQRREPGDRQRALGSAVVGDGAGDHLVLARLAGELEVLLGQLPRGLHGLAAAGGEEDAVEVTGGAGGEPLGELDRGRVRVGPDREEGELLRLGGRGLGELRAPVAGLDDEEPGEPVDVLLAGVVPDRVALAAHDRRDAGAGLVGTVPGEVHPQVVAGGVLHRGAAGGGRRSAHLVPQL